MGFTEAAPSAEKSESEMDRMNEKGQDEINVDHVIALMKTINEGHETGKSEPKVKIDEMKLFKQVMEQIENHYFKEEGDFDELSVDVRKRLSRRGFAGRQRSSGKAFKLLWESLRYNRKATKCEKGECTY